MPNDFFALLRRCLAQDQSLAARDLTDAELLDRFRTRAEEAPFVILIQRHGPMVMGVCRRVLGNREDAEDAFQATFLLLATKAACIRETGALASWLHGAAQRVALNVRKGERRRRSRERRADDMERRGPPDGPERAEIYRILDEELNRLPDKYRAPLVLCYLEGKTNEQAARELRCPKSSLGWRLARARELLRRRLARRDVSISAGALAGLLTGQDATATLPAGLVISTAQAATKVVTDATAVGALVSERVLALTKGVPLTMAPNRSKIVITLLALAGLGGFGVLAWTGEVPTGRTETLKQDPVPKDAPQPKPSAAAAGQPDTDGKSAITSGTSTPPLPIDGRYHLELLRWVATDVDPAKRTIALRVVDGDGNENRKGLALIDMPVPAAARILVNGEPGKITDLEPGMVLSLRLAPSGSEITAIVTIGRKVMMSDVLAEDVDPSRRLIRVKFAQTNAAVDLPVAPDVAIVLDGKPARLGDLKRSARVSVKLGPADGRLVVKAIHAATYVGELR